MMLFLPYVCPITCTISLQIVSFSIFVFSFSVLSPQPQVPKQVFLFNFGLDIQFIIMSEFVTIINNLFLPVKFVL